MAIRKDLVADSGATFSVSVQYCDSTGAGINLTGYAASLVVTDPLGVEVETLTGTVDASGWMSFIGTDEATTLWPFGKQRYFIDLLTPSTAIERLFYGVLNVRFTGLTPVIVP